MSKGRLLLADDSVTIQKVVNLTFADEGIEVVTAGDGDAAINLIAEQRPDIVLADVNMPGLNGYQVCERLRQTDDTKGLPVILLVGSFEPFDEDEAKRVGANGVLTKPFQSIRLLVSQVSELLSASAAANETTTAEAESDDPWSETVAADEPQTIDIDDLYQQSLAETVEIPAAEREAEELGDVGRDDQMIEMISGDGLQVRSSPFEEMVTFDPVVAPAPQSGELPGAPVEPEAYETGSSAKIQEPENIYSNDWAAATDESESVDQKYVFGEGDLLELPGTQRRSAAAPTRGADDAVRAAGLSPELIDLIVQKVIDRLAEKGV